MKNFLVTVGYTAYETYRVRANSLDIAEEMVKDDESRAMLIAADQWYEDGYGDDLMIVDSREEPDVLLQRVRKEQRSELAKPFADAVFRTV